MFDFIRSCLPLFEDFRLKLSVAVTGHGNFTLAVIADDGLSVIPVAGIPVLLPRVLCFSYPK